MPTIVIVDDDYASEILAEQLKYRGHEVRRFASADSALKELKSIAAADFLILDVIMPPPHSGGVSGGRSVGMTIYEGVRKLNPKLPILVHSATPDKDIASFVGGEPHSTFLSKWNTHSMQEVIERVYSMLGLKQEAPKDRPFIVHGQDDAAKLALKNYLQNTLRLPEPIILHEQPNFGRTIIEKFEYYAARSQLAFVLLTPEDKAAPVSAPNEEKRRARQNVILELGFFLGTLGRSSGRVFLLHKGPLELPSDLGGVIYIDISNGIEAAGEAIRKELQHVH